MADYAYTPIHSPPYHVESAQTSPQFSGVPGQPHSHPQGDDLYQQLFVASQEPQPSHIHPIFSAEEPVLIEQGNSAQIQNSRVTATPPAYDPAALLNPKAPNKRPARDSASTEENASDHGQVTFVERLHNVHQRTASPAKRVRTEPEQQQKQSPKLSIQGGGALNLQRENNTPAVSISSQSTAIDLTMSKSYTAL